jgi:hypothetical protein
MPVPLSCWYIYKVASNNIEFVTRSLAPSPSTYNVQYLFPVVTVPDRQTTGHKRYDGNTHASQTLFIDSTYLRYRAPCEVPLAVRRFWIGATYHLHTYPL